MTLSDNDESSNDDDSEQKLEEELFSVFYYHDFSKGIPENLSKKYDISVSDQGVNIALKESNINPSVNDKNDLPPNLEEKEEGELGDTDCDDVENRVEQVESENKVSDASNETPVSRKDPKNEQIGSAINYISSDESSDYVVLADDKAISPKLKEVPEQNFITPKRKKKKKRPKAFSAPAAIVLSSDSDNDSVEIIEPGVYCVKINSDDELSTVSEDSYEEVSTESLFVNMSLPTYMEEIEIDTSYDWRATKSPSTWTKSMRKYYNKPSKELVNFDCSKLIREMRKKKEEWYLSPRDLDYYGLYNRWSGYPRCHRCHEFGHKAQQCVKEDSCNMCGDAGHSVSRCPYKLCLQCGAKRTDVFVAGCSKCSNQKKQQCAICKEWGHIDSICPDVWRRFHSTTKKEDKVIEHSGESKKHCCNCAEEGHLYEECTLLRWSTYPVTKSHVTNYHGETRVKGEHKILLPEHIEEGDVILEQLLTSYKKKGLVISQSKYEGIGLLQVSGKFGIVSHLRSRLMKVFPAPAKKKKRFKSGKRSKKRSKTETIVLD